MEGDRVPHVSRGPGPALLRTLCIQLSPPLPYTLLFPKLSQHFLRLESLFKWFFHIQLPFPCPQCVAAASLRGCSADRPPQALSLLCVLLQSHQTG